MVSGDRVVAKTVQPNFEVCVQNIFMMSHFLSKTTENLENRNLRKVSRQIVEDLKCLKPYKFEFSHKYRVDNKFFQFLSRLPTVVQRVRHSREQHSSEKSLSSCPHGYCQDS